MIYLHKILALLLLPTGVTILLVGAGLLLRRRSLCWLGIAVLWLAATPLLSDAIMRAAEGWQVRRPLSEVQQSQAIIVLSAGRGEPPGDSTVSEWRNPNRFYGGIGLYRAGKAPLLIFTGGWIPWKPNAKPEGEVLAEYAADLGIPPDRMLITPRVMTTDEESRAVAALLAKRLGAKSAPRVVLVTSAFHMRRAQMLFARAGLEVDPFPVDFRVSAGKSFTPLDLLPNGGSLSQSETALRELYGRVYYHLFSE